MENFGTGVVSDKSGLSQRLFDMNLRLEEALGRVREEGLFLAGVCMFLYLRIGAMPASLNYTCLNLKKIPGYSASTT